MANLKYSWYDSKNPKSIEKYAQRLIGYTFQDIEDLYYSTHHKLSESEDTYGNVSRKGGLGNLIEEHYFGYKANSDSEPDFPEAGVELKQTPYEYRRDGSLRAGERVVLTMISYNEPVELEFEKSHLWHKCKLILFVFYWRNRALMDNMLYKIGYAKLFTPPKEDLIIIKSDYKVIIEKITKGMAHELSESDTLYLGACTKGATAEKSIVQQFYFPYTPARKRAFCYKQSYVTYILNQYIVKDKNTYEPIIKDISVLDNNTFKEYIYSLINRYVGITDKELCSDFGREYNNNKAQWTDLTYRMLGIKSNRAEEFQKANIVVKVIRIEQNGKITESMSLPPFKFKELITEEWEDSTLHNYFDETSFLFVVFKSDGANYVLKGCQLWNMPYTDLNEIVMRGWEKIKQVIIDGVVLEPIVTGSGIVIRNNFPKKADNEIIHIRPHAQKRYYEFKDGTIIGDGTKSHSNQLPDGRWMPNQSFWINNSYILSQLKENLK